MSFKCNLYTTLSERTALDKTMELGGIELEGTLINSSNIINPSIHIYRSAETLAAYNYMVIPNFNRRYFITDVQALTAETCIVSGHVDVLSTYKGAIRENTAVVARSENKWNLYLDDNLIKVSSIPKILTKQYFDGGYFTEEPGIALVVVGGNNQ